MLFEQLRELKDNSQKNHLKMQIKIDQVLCHFHMTNTDDSKDCKALKRKKNSNHAISETFPYMSPATISVKIDSNTQGSMVDSGRVVIIFLKTLLRHTVYEPQKLILQKCYH